MMSSEWKRECAVSCLDLSPSGGLGVHGEGDLLYLWNENREAGLLGTVRAHLLDVYCVNFFPSGKVLLSGGADFTLRIWGLAHISQANSLTGCLSPSVVQFVGHRGGILSTDFIDVGKEIVSSSMDGTVKHWDVPSQTCVSTFGDYNQCHVHQVVTDDSSVWSVQDDGIMKHYDVRTKKKVFETKKRSSPLRCVQIQNNYVIHGSDDGKIAVYDRRELGSDPIFETSCSLTSILSLEKDKEQENLVYAGTGDCSLFRLSLEGSDVTKIPINNEHERVTHVKCRKERLFFVCGKNIQIATK